MESKEKNTKKKILEEALKLFAQSGYMGTSMNDIASKLGVTKAALYKHYKSKQEILDSIIEKMNELDIERVKQYENHDAAAYAVLSFLSHCTVNGSAFHISHIYNDSSFHVLPHDLRYIQNRHCLSRLHCILQPVPALPSFQDYGKLLSFRH